LQVGGEKSVILATTGSGVHSGAGIRWPERCFDVTLTIIALPVLALGAIAIAIAIYVDSPGPVIFRSRRVGRNGEPFEMLKFRKMHREASSHPVTLDDDERFTPIGRFLAATRLDELPQVVNVLRGEMRLVGPRPELECFVSEFADQYAEILTVTPGITGNAQLQFVDERFLLSGPHPASAYTDHLLPAKIEVDLDYVRHHTLASDVRIIARTAALPVTLFSASLGQRAAALRLWIPTAACAVLLTLVFVIVSSHLP
jgi:lipopolysaccharide/colanic/teichoic acid biosynthesis glycosyltransferase